MAEYPHYPARVALLKDQVEQLTARVAELEAQIETQGRNCKLYADRTLALEAENAVLRTALGEAVFELGEDICTDNCKHTDCAYRRILVAKANTALSSEAVAAEEGR